LALIAARELAQLELSEVESNELADLIENLVKDSPQTTVAASRFRRIMSKTTPAVVEGFKTLLINVVTEGAKRVMFPGP
jgi:hypothetical protein